MEKTYSWNVVCPVCHSTEHVRMYDTGSKVLFRLLTRNNRYCCGKCSVTWRKKSPGDYIELGEKHKGSKKRHEKED